MRVKRIAGIGKAQALTREILVEHAATLRAGERECDVARALDEKLTAAGVRHWLHTPYAWWGERTAFEGFDHWEADALPTERRLEEGEAFILDAAPLVDGYPADFAYSGVLGNDSPAALLHSQLLAALAEIKGALVNQAREAASGRKLFAQVGAQIERGGWQVVHSLYPGGVLGHSLDSFPSLFGRAPRLLDGFQLPLLGTIGIGLVLHRLLGRPYPLLNDGHPHRVQGLFAVEPHLAARSQGAKFESVLLVDADETRWLDPELFGAVR